MRIFNLIPEGWIISHKSWYRKLWDWVILLLAIFNSLLIPYELGFGVEISLIGPLHTADIAIDYIFLFDLILNIFTSRRDKRGYEIQNHYQVAMMYFKTYRFLIDLLALLGTQVFHSLHHSLKLFQIFKVLRVFRIGQMITNSSLQHHVKILANIGRLVMYLILYLHCLACVTNYAVSLNAPEMFIIQGDGSYKNFNGDSFNNHTVIEADLGVSFGSPPDFVFGDSIKMADYDWKRMESNDSLGWQEFNQRW